MGVGPFDVCSYINQIPSGGSFFTNQVQLHDVGANTPRNDDQIGNAHGGVAATNPIQASFGNAHGGGSGATNPIQASFGNAHGGGSGATNPIQASFGNANKDNEMRDATKVEKLRPDMSDVTLTVKVVSTKIVGMPFADCLVGDETGMIIFRATIDQVDLMKEGLTVTLQNAKVDMFNDSMRLVVDESGSVQVAEPAGFTVKEDSNLSLIQASIGNVNKDNAIKVEKLRPDMSDVTLTVKVVSTKIVGMQFADYLVGDETGMIVFRATNDQVDLMKEGLTVTLQNAKVDMFEDSMRLVVDESGSVQVAEPACFTVKEDNNLSLIEFECVQVYT
ncbi:uncharacterized protein LOC133712788 [Rosa rugosa]|uniref:uncharacterized protein LOC133712788 n=1 Tax=Rosa rugosa TaxID=74645 RepID=UPI002B415CC6|nr:uncharacterized protein LOC133712788 [Rosa rugosa]